MGAPITIQIQRMHQDQPWGFRLQGGRDFRQELSVKKVTPGTPAHGRVEPGDAIVAIGGYDAQQMTHGQASELIKQSGMVLQLTVAKGMYRSIKPKGPVKFSPASAYNRQW